MKKYLLPVSTIALFMGAIGYFYYDYHHPDTSWERYGWKYEDTAAMRRRDTTVRGLRVKEYWTEVAQRKAAEAEDSIAQSIPITKPAPTWRYFRYTYYYRDKIQETIGSDCWMGTCFPNEGFLQLEACNVLHLKWPLPENRQIVITGIFEFKDERDFKNYRYHE